MSKSMLPMFFSNGFIVSSLTFRPLMHFEFIFVYGVRECSDFILLHVVIQFFQHHLLSVSHSVTSDFLTLWSVLPARLLCPWNSPGKNTGVGSHALLQRSSWPRYQTQASFIAGILYHLNRRLFFSIVYSHLLCHRLIDGEYVGLLPGFLSCSWIFTKKRIYFFPLELQKSTSCPWGAHSAQNEGMNPSVKQLISTACFTSNPKNGDV